MGWAPRDRDVKTRVAWRESYSIARSPARRNWEETVEKSVEIEEVYSTGSRCYLAWSRVVKSRPRVRTTSRDLDHRELPLF